MRDNKARFHSLQWTLAMVIGKLAPLKWADEDDVRLTLTTYQGPDPAQRVDMSTLNYDTLVHHIVEAYSTVVDKIDGSMRRHVIKCPIPSGCLQFDIWTSKVTHAKFLGMSVVFILKYPLCRTYAHALICVHGRACHRCPDHLPNRGLRVED